MRFRPIDPPRTFTVGLGRRIEMKDCGRLELAPDEQVTLLTEGGAEYDVARKDWGFYATPSLNSRLKRFGLRGVLVRNRLGHYFLLLVERGREDSFHRYLAEEGLRLVTWMDDDRPLAELESALQGGRP